MNEAAHAIDPAAVAAAPRPTNVLVVGVGGQGVIMVSKVLARLAQRHDLEIKQSEVHGMAKRGGSVFSHVRFGPQVWAPTIPVGEADVLVALEWAEGLRWLPYVDPERGTFIADTKRIVPPFGCTDRRRGATLAYPGTAVADVVGLVPHAYALDAEGMASELGNPRVANTLLLGVLSTVLDFGVGEWREVLAEFVPAGTVETNLAAIETGRAWALDVAARGVLPLAAAPARAPAVDVPTGAVRLDIEAAWCKGCDICVKFCPELCLRLNAERVVELTDPAACTGCRICEWLCPDLALAVRNVASPAEAPA
ncbi:MAG: 2-oxoacid:acceptor oxidoreductase family protein [Gammaproteobacteria bacterium]|nr:2-oxoacid:acceptor oxidoreductase family protein [Gammaproteobacteria bacterium]